MPHGPPRRRRDRERQPAPLLCAVELGAREELGGGRVVRRAEGQREQRRAQHLRREGVRVCLRRNVDGATERLADETNGLVAHVRQVAEGLPERRLLAHPRHDGVDLAPLLEALDHVVPVGLLPQHVGGRPLLALPLVGVDLEQLEQPLP